MSTTLMPNIGKTSASTMSITTMIYPALNEAGTFGTSHPFCLRSKYENIADVLINASKEARIAISHQFQLPNCP